MKSFIDILLYNNPKRTSNLYSITEIDNAFVQYINQQLNDRHNKLSSTRKRTVNLIVTNPTHRWHNLEVKSTLKRNQNGMVRIYRDNNFDFIHHKFLINK